MVLLGVVDMSGTSVLGMLAVPWHNTWFLATELASGTTGNFQLPRLLLDQPVNLVPQAGWQPTLTSGW